MKKLCVLLLACFALSFSESSAQSNVLRLSPFAFGKMKARVHYERALTDKISGGAMASYFFGIYPGFRIEPFARYYLTDEALTGLYVQAKGHYSMNSITVTSTVGTTTSEWKHSFNEYGGSLCLGWQFMLGANKNIALDLYTGYRYSNLKALDNLNTTNLSQDEIDNYAAETLYRVLHSNMFDLGISVGYKF